MKSWKSIYYLALMLCCTFYRNAGGLENNDRRGNEQGNMSLTLTSDRRLAGYSDVVNIRHSKVMFWRPQKVGSSTILSLLTSFGYRYDAPPRRKSSIINSLCIKMASCALHELRSSGSVNASTHAGELLKYLEGYIDRRSYPVNKKPGPLKAVTIKVERSVEAQSFKISSSHQICNLRAAIVKSSLQCTFSNWTLNSSLLVGEDKPYFRSVEPTEVIKELFVVRNPLSRAISIYYFWGELFKMHKNDKSRSGPKGKNKHRHLLSSDGNSEEEDNTSLGTILDEEFRQQIVRAGASDDDKTRKLTDAKKKSKIVIRLGSSAAEPVRGSIFTYHGNESSVPPLGIAMAYAKRLPYNPGMPGPSFTWSSFATDYMSAVEEIKSDRMMTIVTERLSESLVVASHYFGWSLADMVVAAARKALSSHPKHTQWPLSAVKIMQDRLVQWNEYDIYDAANKKLDQRINALSAIGVNVTHELHVLQTLQLRVTKLCMSEEYLITYRDKLQSEGYRRHQSNNKLRDSEEKFNRDGHCFSYNGEIMYSYDICGNCEAHAILFAVKSGLAASVEIAPTLAHIDRTLLINNPDFAKCL